MRSRVRWAMVLALVVVSGVVATRSGGGSEAAAVDERDRPNVVLVLTDDMRADDLRYLPKVGRLLVDRGASFTEAISPHPMCCPARAELVTGQYGQNNGVHHNEGRWGGAGALRHRDENLGRWLQRAGYRTAYHGKFLNGWERERWRPAGWDRWDAQVGGIYSYWRARFYDGDTYRHRYVTDVMTERTDATLRRFHRSRSPFFAIVNHVAPHDSLTGSHLPLVEPRHADRYRHALPSSMSSPSYNDDDVRDLPKDLRFRKVARARLVEHFRARIRALRSVDDAVARMVRRLDRLGELDDTYVVFTSDNGYGLGEHRLDHKNVPLDPALDIPLVVRGPGVAPGTTIDTPVSLVDLPATILDWSGAAAGRRIDGASLAPLLAGGAAPARDTLLVQTGDEVADRTPGFRYRGATTERYLFAIRTDHPRRGILFDRRRDPFGSVNRYADPDYGAVRRELADRVRALSRCAGVAACNRVFGPPPSPG